MKIKKFNHFINEGMDSETVKETGVKYIIDYDTKELKDIYEYIGKKTNFTVDDDDDWLGELLEELDIEYDIEAQPFGDNVSNSSSNPMGIILTPRNNKAKEFLLQILKDINSKKTIKTHTEIYFG